MVNFSVPGWSTERFWITNLYALSKPHFTRWPKTTILDLPPELLEEIFHHYVHEPRNWTKATPSSFVSAQHKHVVNPLILGQVCKQWMGVSRSRSRLWSSLHITEPQMKHVEMVSYWLTLAGKAPLTLSLGLGKVPDPKSVGPKLARDLIDLFLNHYDEWQQITIHLSYANYLASGFQERLPEYRPPVLTYVDIDYGYGLMGPGTANSEKILQFYSNPQVDSVAWYPHWYRPTSLVEIFPHWKNLKHLTYRQGYSANALTVTQVFGLLLGCPVLEHFDAIIHAEHGHIEDILDKPIVHTHLRILDLTLHADRSVHVFDSLACPALEEVNISFLSIASFGVMESADPFLFFLERSNCMLGKFSFDNKGAAEDVLLEILASPQLQQTTAVHLAGVRTKKAIELLTRTSANPSSLSILPRLEQFECKKFPIGTSAADIPQDAIEKMLVSRRTNIQSAEETIQLSPLPLRYIDLDFDHRKPGVWGSLHLERLIRWSVPEIRIPRFAQTLKDWMSEERGFSFGRYAR